MAEAFGIGGPFPAPERRSNGRSNRWSPVR